MIYNAFTNFKTYGGAELIAINLTHGFIRNGIPSCLLSFSDDIDARYDLKDITTTKFSLSLLRKMSTDDIIISHHRKMTTILVVLRNILSKDFRIIHVAHNEFYNLKFLTLFPKEIIAISEKVKNNLIKYFNIKRDNITTIYNGIPDKMNKDSIFFRNSDNVKILLPARIINDVKRQILIVQELEGHLNKNIEIHFAGEGEDLEQLKKIAEGKSTFKVLGFKATDNIINNYDYVMLFSKNEGLPTVFLEAFMYAKPIISNNAGGSLEILDDRVNGFFAPDFKELIKVINSLPTSNSDEYKKLSKKSREKYENNYTIDKMVDSYLNLINNEV